MNINSLSLAKTDHDAVRDKVARELFPEKISVFVFYFIYIMQYLMKFDKLKNDNNINNVNNVLIMTIYSS